MDTQTASPRKLGLNVEQAQAGQTIASNVSKRRTSSSAMSTPMSSAPATPNLHSPSTRRPSHAATSPLQPHSPKPQQQTLRRASSATSLNQRSSASPNLMKKSSRSSLGAEAEKQDEKRPTPKRSISNLISGLREAQTRMESIEEPVPLTAPQIAMEHFARELTAHAQLENTAEVAVILHDACYGHRYSRLKTTKTTLSMIVERPERLHASVLGAASAYVRLGGHHAEGANAPHPDKTRVAQPPFKIRRTGRTMDVTSPYVTNVHGTAWMSELRTMCHAAGERLATGTKELSRSSTPTEPEKRKLHEGDLYLCSESLDAFQGALGGVADAVDTIFVPASSIKRAFVAVRPPGHHCSADYPSGFCWLNNVHVGIEYAAQTYGLTHAAILDFDLHHGDGSQAITWARNSGNNTKRLNAKPHSKLKLGPDIGYYSLHDINSYPCEMGDDDKVQAASLCIENAHGQNIWNVHLQPWKNEAEFWQLYETKYLVLLEKARTFLRHFTARLRHDGKVNPMAAVFISAGFDASEWEGAGMQRHKVNVPTEFYARFTRDVVQLAEEEGTGCEGRVISALEGGYSDRALCSGVLSHLSGLCAMPVSTMKEEPSTAADLDQMMRGLGINGTSKGSAWHYDKTWWSEANLTALELKIMPPPPALAKKMRTGQQPTYATPTESFAYKVVDANKFARSISGTMRDVARPARPPTPPPPEVDWVIATQELHKMLIPQDRQTKSCTAEELAGVKVKRDRTIAVAALSTEESTKPRQLRDRKSKAPAYPESAHSDDLESVRSASRSSRRQTIADLPSSDFPEPPRERRASRRMSAGSTLSSIGGDLDPNPPPVPTLLAASNGDPNGVIKPPPPPAAAMQVKKMRAPPTKPKKTVISSAPVSPAKSTNPVPVMSAQQNGVAGPASNDVDALTSGMKKITLKVGSKEEQDRKQKEKATAEHRARGLKAAETRKANAAARKAAQETMTVPAAKPGVEPIVTHTAKENTAPPTYPPPGHLPHPATSTPASAQPPFVSEASTAESLLPEYTLAGSAAQDVPLDASFSPAMPTAPEIQQQPFDQQPALPVEPPAYYEQPLHAPSSPPVIDHTASPTVDSAARQLLQEDGLANNTYASTSTVSSSPLRPQSRADLPVWSSTGMIPFAASAQQYVSPSNFDKSGGTNSPPTSHPASGQHVDQEEKAPIGTTSGSIWDVPETPRH